MQLWMRGCNLPEGADTDTPTAYRPLGGKALAVIAAALFLMGTLIHIACGDFPKTIDVMPDEMRYLDIARSLFSGDGLVIRGEASSFQKILYPLSLFPALLFPDGQDQVRAMNILNSAYACSAVFPALLIARRLFRNPVPVVACMAFTLLLPDLMYSMTFMTESIFIPLSLWLVYLCWRCFQAGGAAELALAAGAGLLCYLVYLCKEVAWMYLISFLAWYIVAIARKRVDRQQGIMATGLFLIGFLAPFVLMKLTLFSGLLNSYSQFSFDILLSPYTVLFGLYSLATDATYFIIGFGVFPVLYLACVYRDMPQSERDLAFFCLLSLAVGLAVVVFTISMREDVGHVALRQHLRYVIPLFIPLLMLFIRHVARSDPSPIVHSPRRRGALVGITVGFCLMTAAFFGSANLQQGFDNSQFHFMRWLLGQSAPLAQEYFDGWSGALVAIDASDGDLLVIDPVNWACRALVVAFTAAGMLLLMNRRERVRLATGAAICGVLAALMVANSVVAFQYNRGAYGADQEDVDEICLVDGQLAGRDGDGGVVVVMDGKNTKSNNLIDTYLQDGPGDYRYLGVEELRVLLNGDGDGTAPSVAPPDPIGYILVNANQNITFVSGEVEQIGGAGDGDGRFILYRVTGDGPLKMLSGGTS